MSDDFEVTFAALRALLKPYEPLLVVKRDSEGDYYLDTAHTCKNHQPLFFAAAAIKKRYVSLYLMPIYVYPELAAGLSEGLAKRRQGKSCFNFTAVDPVLFAELETLIAAGFDAFRTHGMLTDGACAAAPDASAGT